MNVFISCQTFRRNKVIKKKKEYLLMIKLLKIRATKMKKKKKEFLLKIKNSKDARARFPGASPGVPWSQTGVCVNLRHLDLEPWRFDG